MGFLWHLSSILSDRSKCFVNSLVHSSIHALMAEPNSQGATFIGHMIGDCSLAVARAGLRVSAPPAELREH